MNANISFHHADWEQNKTYLEKYIHHLAYPMDSYMEDNLEKCQVFSIKAEEVHIGFAAKLEEFLMFFYLEKPWIRFSREIFDQFIKEQKITTVYFQTSDTLLVSLVCDWEFQKHKSANFFIDGGRIEKPQTIAATASFRVAKLEDIETIKKHTGDFFDNLEDKVQKETIFMLMDGDALLGCGIVEYGRLFKKCASIGMIVCKEHRKKGVGQMILWHLKEFCYEKGINPIAGCWYYNTLSRKTLEKANMVSVVRGMRAQLIEKEILRERTGNPPGEDV